MVAAEADLVPASPPAVAPAQTTRWLLAVEPGPYRLRVLTWAVWLRRGEADLAEAAWLPAPVAVAALPAAAVEPLRHTAAVVVDPAAGKTLRTTSEQTPILR